MTSANGSISLPRNLRGRSLHQNVIPTVCNLKNMLDKLDFVQGDASQLKQWEKRSYQAYRIDKIKALVLNASKESRVKAIKDHILNEDPNDMGAGCIDMYLVAFVAEQSEPGKQSFIEYVLKNGITEKENSAQAIWQVGKGDGVYLGILNDDGTIRDWDFFVKWVNGKNACTEGKDQKSIQIHNKLVRDRIPEIIEKSGKMYRSRVLDDEEFITELRKKAFEELQEYMTTSSNDEAAEELADILEVIHALADYHGLTIGAVEQVRKRKYEIRGGFKERVFLMEIEE